MLPLLVGRAGRRGTCVRISFVTGDTINGPLHSNDTISVNGSPTFNDKVTTGSRAP